MRRLLLLVLTVGFWLTAGAAMAGQFVVVSSTDTKWKPGQVIASGATIELADGQRLSLVGSDGKTLIIKGPFKGALKAPDSGIDLTDKLSRMLSADVADARILGATRDIPNGLPGTARTPRPPLNVPTDAKGRQCVMAGAPPVLWRSNSAQSATARLMRVGSTEQANLRWNGGQAAANWPGEVAVVDGGRYLLRVQGRPSAAEFELKLIPQTLPTDGHKALWMNEQGCTEQARLLLKGEG